MHGETVKFVVCRFTFSHNFEATVLEFRDSILFRVGNTLGG